MTCCEQVIQTMRTPWLIAATALLLLNTAAGQENQVEKIVPSEPEAALRHVEAAKLIAGDAFSPVAGGYLCQSPQAAAAVLARAAGAPTAHPPDTTRRRQVPCTA